MLERIPSEVSFGWVYFPPFFFTVLAGFVAALVTARVMNAVGLGRLFWHPGLVFVALWTLMTSILGLTIIPP